MTVNGYWDVRRWQRRGAKLPGKRSPTITRKIVGEPARGTHGKSWDKDVVNLVTTDRRITGDFEVDIRITPRPKRHAACRRCSVFTAVSSYMQPGESVFLKVPLNVHLWERGKPGESRNGRCGIRTVRNGKGSAGKGRQRKQMPSCSVMDRMKSSCDRIIRRESGPTSGGSWRWERPSTILAAGDVRRWGNPPNEAADTRWCVGYSERQDHRGIGYTLKAIVKSGRLGYAVTRCQSSEAQARCGETRPPGFWKGGVPRGTPPIRLHIFLY